MTDEGIRQRIAYLVTHGGIYPRGRPPWFWWAVAIVALQVVDIALTWSH